MLIGLHNLPPLLGSEVPGMVVVVVGGGQCIEGSNLHKTSSSEH